MQEPITVQEAELKRQERAQVVKINEGSKPRVAEIDQALARLANLKVMTPEEEAARHAEHVIEESQKRQSLAHKLLHDSGAPARHLHAVKIKAERAWVEVLHAITEKRRSGFLVGLVGKNGNGKTQIAVELIKGYTQDGLSAHYLTTMQFFLEIKRSYRKDSLESEMAIIDRYSRGAFLCLDEFEVRSETQWEDRLLFQVLNQRYNRMVDTLVISNQPPSVMYDALGASLTSRMRETGGVFTLTCESFR